MKWQNRIVSRDLSVAISGAEVGQVERKEELLHAADGVCCRLSPCSFAPEQVVLVHEIHHRRSELGDEPKTLWAQLIQSEEKRFM